MTMHDSTGMTTGNHLIVVAIILKERAASIAPRDNSIALENCTRKLHQGSLGTAIFVQQEV
jgi:hypothetical protein